MLLGVYLFKVGLRVNYIFKQLQPILVVEGWESCEHLMNKAAQAPPIDINSMALLPDYLRCQILRSATDCECFLLAACQDFREPKISQLDVPALIDYDIFWFETGLKNRYSR